LFSRRRRARSHFDHVDPIQIDTVRCSDGERLLQPLLVDGVEVPSESVHHAISVSDKVGVFWSHHREYLAWLRDPAHRLQSGLLAMDEGTELPLRVG
jgi:hypothetical protein